jgi:hypothetical protein
VFDDLDDPAPPTPGPAERAAVAARAGRMLRRRQGFVLGAGTLSAVAAVLLVQLPPDAPAREALTTTTTTPTATAEPTPALPTAHPGPTEEVPPSPLATPSRTATPVLPTTGPSPTATASPTASPVPTRGGRPTRPSWSTGFTSCTVKDPGASTAPAAGLTLRLVLADRVVAAGERLTGELVVTNGSSETVRFDANRFYTDDGTLIDSTGWAAAARTGTDAIAVTSYELAPGESARVDVGIRTESCGTEQGSYEPLPPGDYQAVAELSWTTPGGYGDWWSQRVPVTVTP